MFDIVTIGASSGGIKTCCKILSLLPQQFSWPIVLVQHLQPSQDAKAVAKILDLKSKIKVVVAEDGLPIQAKHVYISPANTHMLINLKKKIDLMQSEKIMYCRPSIDVLFNSVAHVFRHRAIGIILTGANEDGTAGLAAIKKNGGYTIVQNPDTAVMKWMPRSVLDRFEVDTVLSPIEIGNFLKDMWFLTNQGRNYDKQRKI